MFGSAYLDGPDDTGEVPEELANLSARKINGVIKRKFESLSAISCATSQAISRHFLNGHDVSFDDMFSVTFHTAECSDPVCQGLNNILCQEKYYSLDILQALAREAGLL